MVALFGAAVWVIIAFFLHQHRVAKGLKDEFDAQRQVILRNGATPVGSVLAYWSMGRTWNKRAPNAWRRSILNILPPLLAFIVFTVASVFVGQVAENSTNSRVLLNPNPCGTVITTDNSAAAQLKFAQLYGNISQISDAYARACYARSTSQTISCSSYAAPRIAYTTAYNASCPLGEGNCELGGGQAFNLHASRINSHDDFGINAPTSERIQLDYDVTCAPVSHSLTQSLTYASNFSGLRDNTETYSVLQFRVGDDLANGFPVAYNYSTVVRAWGTGITGYSVSPFKSYCPHNGTGSWLPVSPFNSTQTDLTMYIMTPNGILYSAPNTDPIFSTFNSTLTDDARFYAPDYFFRAMVCTERYQICKDSGNTCTPGVPFFSLFDEVPKLQLDANQNATYIRMLEAIGNSNMALALATPSSLRASDYLLSGAQSSAGLPNNQWAAEAEGWSQTVLARMQYITQSYAVLPSFILDQASQTGLEVVAPDSPELQSQCTNQRIQIPAGYTSYNVFGLVFIFVITVLAIFLIVFVSQCPNMLPGRKPGGKNHYKLLAYQADGQLQLQRMAFEGAGLSGWRSGIGARKDVPYTERGTNLVPPAIVEEKGFNDDGLVRYEKVGAMRDDESDGTNVGVYARIK